jgi:hypothetical protein
MSEKKFVPIVQEIKVLDTIANNPDHELAGRAKDKLGVDDRDIEAWRAARENPNHELSAKVTNKVLLKIADAKPVTDEQSVSFNERLIAKNLLNGDPDLVIPFLEKRGHDVRVETETQNIPGSGSGFGLPRTRDVPRFYIRDRQTNQWGPMDPSELSLVELGKDISDVAGVVASSLASAGGAALGAPLGPGGMAAGGGAGAAGLETLKQATAKVLGAREEISGADIATEGVVGAVAGLVPGKIVSRSKSLGIPGTSKIPFMPRLKVTAKAKPVTGISKAGAEMAKDEDLRQSALQRRARRKE